MFQRMTPSIVITIAAVVISLFFIRRYFAFAQRDISKFILLDSRFIDQDQLLDKSVFVYDSGYDGQFYYRYALNPFKVKKRAYGIEVDDPQFRRQRITYSFLAWMVSFGQAEWVPWSMVVINILGLLGIVMTMVLLFKYYQIELIYALFPLLIVGFWMSLSRNTTEITEGLFLSLSLYAIVKQKWWQYALFASLTVLSREGAIILLGGGSVAITLYAWQEGKLNLKLLFCLLTPLIIFLSHRQLIDALMPREKFPPISDFLGPPFAGITEGVMLNTAEAIWVWPAVNIYIGYTIGLALLTGITINYGFSLQKYTSIKEQWLTPFLTGAIAVWIIFLIFLKINIYIEDWGYMRISSTFFLLAFLFLILKNKRLNFVLLALAFICCFSFAIRAWQTA